MADQWYLSRNGQQYGPYAWADLCTYAQAGNVTGSDLLWSETSGGWLRADQLPALLPMLSVPAPSLAATRSPATHVAATTPRSSRRKHGSAWFLVIALIVAVAGGASWFLWLRTPAPEPPQTGPAVTPRPTLFWEQAASSVDADDWRNSSDLAEEQAAIAAVLTGFAAAMEAGDLDVAVNHIQTERQDAYRELFASNPADMASFAAVISQAEMSFLSEHSPVMPFDRIAEYRIELDGVAFYMMFTKIDDTWVLYDF